MKASDARKNNYKCPKCGGKLSQDRKGLGYVRHLHRLTDGSKCSHGWGERDSHGGAYEAISRRD